MSLVSLLVVMALVPSYSTAVKSVNISSGNELVDYLCATSSNESKEQYLNESMELYLDSSKHYTVSVNRSCVVDGRSVHSIVLKSAPSVAIVNCKDQNTSYPVPNFGIAFVNVTHVEISGIIFSYCGSQLKKLKGLNLNNSIATTRLFFSPYHSALFVFVNSSVLFYKTAINQYYGFAVIGIDLINANFTEFYVTQALVVGSNSILRSVGSGVLVMYTKSIRSQALVLNGCDFHANYFIYSDNINDCVTLYSKRGRVYNAAALSILAYDISNVFIDIFNTKFTRNLGTHSGALLVAMMNASHFNVTIDQSHFKSNYGMKNCPGSALGFYVNSQERYVNYLEASVVSLSIVNTIFCKNKGIVGADGNNLSLLRAGAAYVEIKNPWSNVSVNVHNVTFKHNIAVQFPSCLFVQVYGYVSSYVHVSLQHLTVTNNNQSVGGYISFDNGLFAFINVFKVELTGENSFDSNYGTVFRSYRSPFYLNGNASFSNNTALAGAVINIKNSYLDINCSHSIILIGNRVDNFGGALYVKNDNPDLCAVQFSSEQCGIVSTDNFAHDGGNIMYAFPIYNCHQIHWNESYVGNNTRKYTKQFSIKNSIKRNNALDVSTKVAKIIVNGSDRNIKLIIYPGEELFINISILDEAGNNVYSLVRFDLVKSLQEKKFLKDDSFALLTENVQVIEETRNKSSLFTLKVKITTVHINKTNFFRLYVRPLNVYKSVKQNIILNINDCPNGFTFIGNNGICGCSPAVNEYYKRFNFDGYCDITSGIIHIPSLLVNPWLGQLENGSYNIFIIAYTCPENFCRSREKYSYFKVMKESETIELFNKTATPQTVSVCQDNRTGLLCGECDEGLSVVFGSTDCIKCSNWWLATIAVYIVVGPLLVFLMYHFQLTLTGGTLNGIIFYAQMANVGLLQMLKLYSKRKNPFANSFASFLSIFLSLLNFDLGFPLCFYNGMNELWKAGLLLVFPLYLLSIAGFLIILSRRFSRLSNRFANSSVQILTTIVHLSLSKLLIITIDVFTPVMLYHDSTEDNTRVWYRNGNINFSFQEQGLITLMAFTIVITSVFLVPYMCLIIGGKWLIRSSLGDAYFRSAYESIHAPFREKRRYWFLARFFLLITLYLIYAIFRSYNPFLMNVISLPLLIIFLFLQLHLRPFKNKFINILDSFVLFDLTILYFLSWYIHFNPQIDNVDKFMISFEVLVLIIFLIFVGVVTYHVLLVTGALHRIVATWNIRTSKYRGFRRSLDASTGVSASFNNSYGNQRETLFEHS